MKITVLDAFGLNQGDLNFKEFEKFGEVVCYDITPQEEVCLLYTSDAADD